MSGAVDGSVYTQSEQYLPPAYSLDQAVDIAQRRLRQRGRNGEVMLIYRDGKPLVMARYRNDGRERVELMMYPHFG